MAAASQIPPMPGAVGRPSATLQASLRDSLRLYAPFSAMETRHLEQLLRGAVLAYFEPDRVILEPDGSLPGRCWIIRQGIVAGERPLPSGDTATAWELGAGEMFPLAALLEQRPVTSRYRAIRDTFCVVVEPDAFASVLRASPGFADFCRRRLGHLLDRARLEAQSAHLADATAQLGLASPLLDLIRRPPVHCTPDTPVGDALARMDAQKVGSMLVVDAGGRPVGIFTQRDVIGRVVLPRLALDTPMSAVMSAPVQSLPADATAGDAVVLMTRHGLRHVAVVDSGRLVGVASERDLFALQRLSSRQVGSTIRRASDLDALVKAAGDVRELARALVAQGAGAGQLTRLLSSLNDQLTLKLIEQALSRHELEGITMCWLAFGSEGRHEQTIATDQDNGLIFETARDVQAARGRLLAFAREVNAALDACGYPLCKGEVMASNPRWCATLDEWRATFGGWIDRGDPESLLAASIFFDFRGLWGATRLADQLREEICASARGNRRFLKQLADNALRNRPPLGMFGGLKPDAEVDGAPAIDLKMHGSVPIVDAARIYALASGVKATNTGERLREVGKARSVPEEEVRGLIDALEFIQVLRLRTQLRRHGPVEAGANFVRVCDLSEVDRQVLKEAFRQARRIQSRLQLDYPG